jgi:hypothetical protein
MLRSRGSVCCTWSGAGLANHSIPHLDRGFQAHTGVWIMQAGAESVDDLACQSGSLGLDIGFE